jgi:SOS-response transcriptional repressor LexA
MEHTLGQRLKQARKEANLTQEQLADISGVSQTDISKIERGKIQNTPSVIPLALALRIDPVVLQTGEPSDQKTIRAQDTVTPWSTLGRVPLLSKEKAGMYLEEIREGNDLPTVQTVSQVNRYTFAMKIDGDSMEPVFTSGCIVVVEPDIAPVGGDYVLAQVGSEATVKQLVIDAGERFLKQLNNRYPIKPLGDVVLIGKVVSSHTTF